MNKASPPSQFSLMETLLGAWQVMLGRPDGLRHMDLTSNGLWVSFWGLGLAGLLDASMYSMNYSTQTFVMASDPPSKIWYIFASLGISIIAYAASMLALFLLCRSPQEQQRFSIAVVVNNWASAIVSLIVLPVMVLTQIMQTEQGDTWMTDIWAVIAIMFFATIFYAGINLLRVSLDVSRGKAFAFMCATTLISIIFGAGLESMLGLFVS